MVDPTFTGELTGRPVGADGRELWSLTDHVCRVCFGRVLASATKTDGAHRYRCSNCGLEEAGRKPGVLCACGLKLKNGHDAGIRCELNPEPTPEFPSEVVASQVGQ